MSKIGSAENRRVTDARACNGTARGRWIAESGLELASLISKAMWVGDYTKHNDECALEIIDLIASAGLAVVPVEPTCGILDALCFPDSIDDDVDAADVYGKTLAVGRIA